MEKRMLEKKEEKMSFKEATHEIEIKGSIEK